MPRRTKAAAAATRESILDAARQLFATHGYAAATTSAIAATAGVSQAAFFHHFPDKTAAFHEVATRMVAELRSVSRAAGERAMVTDGLRAAFFAGCRAGLGVLSDPEFRQIVAIDAPAVLGPVAWGELQHTFGETGVAEGFHALRGEGILPDSVDIELMSLIFFAALSRAGTAIAAGHGDADRWMHSLEAVFDGLILVRASR
jgi:AcrR family transcriptional regulator